MTENERLTLKSVNGDVWLLDSEGKPYLLSVDGDDYNNALNRLADFEAIGTIEEFKVLKEKSVAKKQGNVNDNESHLRLDEAGFLCCGATGKVIRYPLISLRDLEYCPCCGQKLDWQ